MCFVVRRDKRLGARCEAKSIEDEITHEDDNNRSKFQAHSQLEINA